MRRKYTEWPWRWMWLICPKQFYVPSLPNYTASHPEVCSADASSGTAIIPINVEICHCFAEHCSCMECMYTSICMYVCMHVCMYLCIYVRIYVVATCIGMPRRTAPPSMRRSGAGLVWSGLVWSGLVSRFVSLPHDVTSGSPCEGSIAKLPRYCWHTRYTREATAVTWTEFCQQCDEHGAHNYFPQHI